MVNRCHTNFENGRKIHSNYVLNICIDECSKFEMVWAGEMYVYIMCTGDDNEGLLFPTFTRTDLFGFKFYMVLYTRCYFCEFKSYFCFGIFTL